MDRVGQQVPGKEEPLGNSDDRRLLVHCWEIENKAQKQVIHYAKCWQKFQSKQNWNAIWRIPFEFLLEWLYGYADREFMERSYLSKCQSSEGFQQ